MKRRHFHNVGSSKINQSISKKLHDFLRVEKEDKEIGVSLPEK